MSEESLDYDFGSVPPAHHALPEAWTFWFIRRPAVRSNDSYSKHLKMLGVVNSVEDDANRLGGKLYFRVRKGHSSRMWEDMLLALIGGQFHGCGVCGAVISTRFSEDCISIWNRDARDEGALHMLRDTVRRVLKLRPGDARRASRPNCCIHSPHRYLLLLMLMFSLFILCDGDLPHCRVDRWPRAGVQTARHQPEQAGRCTALRNACAADCSPAPPL
jgi:hypothetical protein